MIKVKQFIYLSTTVFLTLACGAKHEGNVGSDTNTLGSGNSIAIFESTLKPIIQQNCAGCHGVSQSPKFAVADSTISHDLLINTNLVNLNNPTSSRLVAKINGGHQSISVSVATSLQNAIASWGSQLEGGPDPVTPPEVLTPTFASISKLILTSRCANCHSPGGTEPYYDNYANTVKSVVAGNPNSSSLYTEVKNNSMPQNSVPLSKEEKAAIQDWITAGALNN